MNGNSHPPFSSERLDMVEAQLRRRGITDQRVLAAMSKVPRHEFVPQQYWPEAYADHPVPIGQQQTTSQPYIIAALLPAPDIKPQDPLLELRAGSGFQTARRAGRRTRGSRGMGSGASPWVVARGRRIGVQSAGGHRRGSRGRHDSGVSGAYGAYVVSMGAVPWSSAAELDASRGARFRTSC